jgi:hypothetical protein
VGWEGIGEDKATKRMTWGRVFYIGNIFARALY